MGIYVPNEITSDEDVIDSRDVEARIDALTEWIEDEDEDENDREAYKTERDNLYALKDAARDMTEEWDDGAPIVRESYWEDYVREMVKDCGYFDNKDIDWNRWPYKHIDWEGVAEELGDTDYATFEWDGVTWYIR